jgi:hypothetical protein
MITSEKLIHLEASLEIEEPSTPITGDKPPCPACGTPLEFTDMARENILFKFVCKVTQTVFSCPECYARLVIFSKGDVPAKPTAEGNVVFGPPMGGFHIAKVA